MSQFLSHPAFWGFWSAFVYAGTVLSNGLWMAQPPPDARGRKHLVASFVLALVFGPLAAEAFTPDVAAWLGARLGFPPKPVAVAVGIGLCANYLWPVALKLSRLRLLGFADTLLNALKSSTKETSS